VDSSRISRLQIVDSTVAPEHMRELMGHATSRMTDEVYWHARGEAQARAAAIMGEHLAELLDKT
jgi:hypothetical protein